MDIWLLLDVFEGGSLSLKAVLRLSYHGGHDDLHGIFDGSEYVCESSAWQTLDSL